MPPIAHPGRLLRRELAARGLSANRLALGLGVASGRITDILNGRRSINADTVRRLGRYSATARNSGSTCSKAGEASS
jgi:antitoxin HigA-1